MSYIEIDGTPACRFELSMVETTRLHEKYGRLPTCSGRDKEADAEMFRFALPESVVVIREGGCPAYAEEEDDYRNYSMTREEALEARVVELTEVLGNLVNDLGTRIDDDPEGFGSKFINTGCNECTRGCTPAEFDRGPCPYHRAVKLVKGMGK